jgi:hypothetical protein
MFQKANAYAPQLNYPDEKLHRWLFFDHEICQHKN